MLSDHQPSLLIEWKSPERHGHGVYCLHPTWDKHISCVTKIPAHLIITLTTTNNYHTWGCDCDSCPWQMRATPIISENNYDKEISEEVEEFNFNEVDRHWMEKNISYSLRNSYFTDGQETWEVDRAWQDGQRQLTLVFCLMTDWAWIDPHSWRQSWDLMVSVLTWHDSTWRGSETQR